MSAGHTPGPWKVVMQYGVWHVREDPLNWDGRGYQHIASLPTEKKGSHYGDMFSANARLIAAAPELLDELRKLRRAYVNLLEGGRDRILQLGGDCDPLDAMASSDPYLRSAAAAIDKVTKATP